MLRFRDASIRSKLIALLVTVVFLVLLLSTAAFVVHDIRMFRTSMQMHLETLAAVLADNSSAPLDLDSAEAASHVLAALQREPSVVYAETIDGRGKTFAIYPQEAAAVPLPSDSGTGEPFVADGFLHVFKPIKLFPLLPGDPESGTLYLRASLEQLHKQLRRDLLIAAVILAVCLTVAILLAFFAQRLISTPIQRLVVATQEISTSGNYAVRVAKQTNDEIGVLIDEFNAMLTQLQTRDRELAEHREQLEEQVELRTQELSATAKDLARSNTELEQFAYVASHDLQEPLRMVSSYLQLLQRKYQGQLDASADKYIAYAVDGAARMQRMINDLLAYSRVMTRGKAPEPTDCERAWADALANLERRIHESAAVVTHDPLPTVHADASQLIQVFQNLVGNAIKYHGAETPHVHASAQRQPGQWVFSVRDNGIGIEPQYFERIFVIFQRLHGKEEYSGTGIGLAVCKKIVERHGGKIWVESQYGTGSTFYFTIPDRQ
ncbi:MAG: HAMP domain-containing protein [Pirellulaceae bacterium]|nr:HAMP domain-containing protein [Pirellulaceae bacterium]